MGETKLKISPTLSLPLDFVTSTQAILAKKGKGKTYKASVQAEELLDAHQQIVAIDPTGAWYGLRSSADGKAEGYPVTIFGGEHADVPLEATAGEVIAEAIASEHFSAVIDLTLFRKGEALRFMAAFLETLYRKNRAPLHLFIDEADVVAPQKPFGPDEARVLGACEDIVRRGRIRGIGCTLITQRPQVLNKNVLSQVDMLTALGMNHPKDIGAIKDWVAVHGDESQAKQMIADLPALPQGEAWIWAPAADIFKRVTFRDRRTFDSGKTPKAGERRVVPKVLAPIDLARLGETIAASVQRAKDNDPKVLRGRVAELEKQLASKPTAKVETKVVEKPVIKEAQLQRVGILIEQGEGLIKRWNDVSANAHEALTAVEKRAGAFFATLGEQLRDLAGAIRPANIRAPAAPASPRPPTQSAASMTNRRENVSRNIPAGDPALEPRLRKILGSIAWWEAIGIAAPDSTGVAFVAGYSPTSSGFEKARSTLRTLGLIDYPSSGTVQLTDLGRRAAPTPERPSTNADLHAAVLRKLEPRHGRLLTPLIGMYPDALDMQALADASEYSPTSSGFEKARGTLRSLGLVTYPRPGQVRAADLLFPEAA